MSFWQIVLVVGKKNSYLLIEMNLRQKHFFCIFLFDSSFVLRYYARLKKNIIRSTSPLFAIFSIGLFPCLKNYRIKVYVFEQKLLKKINGVLTRKEKKALPFYCQTFYVLHRFFKQLFSWVIISPRINRLFCHIFYSSLLQFYFIFFKHCHYNFLNAFSNITFFFFIQWQYCIVFKLGFFFRRCLDVLLKCCQH